MDEFCRLIFWLLLELGLDIAALSKETDLGIVKCKT